MNSITLRDTSSSFFFTCSKINGITHHDADCLILVGCFVFFFKSNLLNLLGLRPRIVLGGHFSTQKIIKMWEFYIMSLKLRILHIDFLLQMRDCIGEHSPLEASFFL